MLNWSPDIGEGFADCDSQNLLLQHNPDEKLKPEREKIACPK